MQVIKYFYLAISIGLVSCAGIRTGHGHKSESAASVIVPLSRDTLPRNDNVSGSATTLKMYNEVITKDAVSDKGLFSVHRIGSKYFFEIPDSLMDKQMLVVNRISKSSADNRTERSLFGYAGDYIGENVIQFSRGPDNKIFLKRISFFEMSKDSTENGLYTSVQNSNLQPIVAGFDVKAITPDSLSCVIEITDYINGDNDIFFFNQGLKKNGYNLGGLQADKSYIQGIISLPQNIEIKTVKTYSKGDAFATYELNSSLLVLPGSPMKPRNSDSRVGYFSTQYNDFDENPQGVSRTSFITRWRLEPRDKDIERYSKGELVEPKNPIVFYIDPATPKKWIPYLILGVNDWQKAFEKAGFCNAIYALEAPLNDSGWNLNDAMHNAIVYKPSAVKNASGPNVHDPRTGEILEAHINWYHNIMVIMHDWYMVQAGPYDANARKMEFSDSLMGKLIRFVSSHEVGHTLGLTHNFGASSTIPVDSLRSKSYVEKNGFCPSVMDYARFNYVAQPGDDISENGIFPRIGIYDEWAIEWGYRWFPDFTSAMAERDYMNKWVIRKLKEDKRLWFGAENSITDPRSQAEDIGDNAVKAGNYGIKNLRMVMDSILQWTKEPASDFTFLKRIQAQLVNQYRRYLLHVARSIGGIMWTAKTTEQDGPVVTFTNREKQQEAVMFIQKQLFENPAWIINPKVFSLIGGTGLYEPMNLQKELLGQIISYPTIANLLWFQTNNPKEAYTFSELLSDVSDGVWSELKTQKPVGIFRRNLQKTYVDRLEGLMSFMDFDKVTKRSTTNEGDFTFAPENMRTDAISIIKGELRDLKNKIMRALPGVRDKMTRLHFYDLSERLTKILNTGNAAKN